MQPSANVKITNKDYLKTYNVIHFGDVAFEGHSSKKYKYGRFVVNDYKDGIVSHVFDVYRPTELIKIEFAKYFIHNEQVMQKALLFSTSNARMLNALKNSEIIKQVLPLPELSEQSVIANLFDSVDNLITANQ